MPPVFAFPLMRPLLMAGVCESSAKELAKVKVYFEGSGPVSLAKKLPNQQQPVREGDSVMLAACLQGYEKLSVIIWCDLASDE